MTPAVKTSSILLLAGLVASGAGLLTQAAPVETSAHPRADASGHVVRALLQSSHVLLGADETHMAVTITAPTLDANRARPPVHLAIVIDRSGSMAGDKLAHAKQAARQLVSQLAAADRFSIVSYGSSVSVPFPSTHATIAVKNAAYEAIDAIYEDGGTNLSGGLIAGREQLLAQPYADAVQRIVLISDGHANEGITHTAGLLALAVETAKRGISITTVGVGLDFDEQSMTGIAVSGRGNYYFAESAFMLADSFEHELAKLGATTATSVHLKLTPAPGVEILDAYGYPVERESQHLHIPVADLHAGETRKVVLRLRVNAERMGELPIADVAVSLTPTGADTPETLATTVRAQVTDDLRLVADSRDRDAVRHIERARTAIIIDQATRYYEAGNADMALQLLDKRKQDAASMAQALGDDELAAEMDQVTGSVHANFAQAPPGTPSSSAGKRASKANRKSAYDLVH